MLSVNLSTLRHAALPFVFVLMSAPAQAQDPLSVVDDYLAAWNAHDSTAAVAFLAEDVRYYDSSVGTAVQGREAAKTQVIDAFPNAAPDGDWSDGTAASRKPYSFEGMTMITVTNGKIRTQSDYYDALGFYTQLGLM